jgi:hypothetical protein
MIIRKSKHEFRVTLTGLVTNDRHETKDWCTTTLGPGGRNKKCRWRYGWTQTSLSPGWTQTTTDIFYFKSEKDALHFALRWM